MVAGQSGRGIIRELVANKFERINKQWTGVPDNIQMDKNEKINHDHHLRETGWGLSNFLGLQEWSNWVPGNFPACKRRCPITIWRSEDTNTDREQIRTKKIRAKPLSDLHEKMTYLRLKVGTGDGGSSASPKSRASRGREVPSKKLQVAVIRLLHNTTVLAAWVWIPFLFGLQY